MASSDGAPVTARTWSPTACTVSPPATVSMRRPTARSRRGGWPGAARPGPARRRRRRPGRSGHAGRGPGSGSAGPAKRSAVRTSPPAARCGQRGPAAGRSGASVERRPGRRGTAPGGRGRPGRAAPGPGPTSGRWCGRSAASRPGSGAGTRPNSCRPAPPNLRGRRCAASCAAALRAAGSPPPCSRSPGAKPAKATVQTWPEWAAITPSAPRPVSSPDFGEVLAVVHGVDDHQLAVALHGRGEVELQQPGGDAPGRGRGIGRDQDGLGRGQDVLLARQRLLQEQCLQGQHVLGAGELGEDRARSHGPHGADLVSCVLVLQGFPLLSQSRAASSSLP